MSPTLTIISIWEYALFIYSEYTFHQPARGSFIPRPSYHPVFDCSQYAKERPGLFYHMNVRLVIAEGRGIRQALLFSCKVCPNAEALNIGEVEDLYCGWFGLDCKTNSNTGSRGN